MRKWRSTVVFRIAIAVLGTGQALAQTDPAERLAAGFAGLAGSQENALAIVRGMNTGRVISIRETNPELPAQIHAFNMVEGAMSWEEVDATLARVRTRFARQGITQPTASELQAALVPGIAESPRVAGRSGTGLPRTVSTTVNEPKEPEILASAWGRYRPSERTSNRFEKFPGIN